jgi:2-polyprenyl-3-methyl-5-hydroxy-6-metoxy-1,4-benzoquinol methylase
MFKKSYLSFLACPDCRGNLSEKSRKLTCQSCGSTYPIVNNIPILLSGSMAGDVKLSQEKWDSEYKKTINAKKAKILKENFRKTYQDYTMKYIKDIFKSYRSKKYLEIGCGPFFIGQALSKEGAFIVGIDYSMNALNLAKFYLKDEGIENYLLVCGDIAKMPFKDNSFDLLYGGGVIEHFKDTVGVVKENFRVLKEGGFAFNSVPKLNLGSLTYRQVWGNIPNAPVLRELSEFVLFYGWTA